MIYLTVVTLYKFQIHCLSQVRNMSYFERELKIVGPTDTSLLIIWNAKPFCLIVFYRKFSDMTWFDYADAGKAIMYAQTILEKKIASLPLGREQAMVQGWLVWFMSNDFYKNCSKRDRPVLHCEMPTKYQDWF